MRRLMLLFGVLALMYTPMFAFSAPPDDTETSARATVAVKVAQLKAQVSDTVIPASDYDAVRKRVENGERLRYEVKVGDPRFVGWPVGMYDCWRNERGDCVMRPVRTAEVVRSVPFPVASYTTPITTAPLVATSPLRPTSGAVSVPWPVHTGTPVLGVGLVGGTDNCPPAG